MRQGECEGKQPMQVFGSSTGYSNNGFFALWQFMA